MNCVVTDDEYNYFKNELKRKNNINIKLPSNIDYEVMQFVSENLKTNNIYPSDDSYITVEEALKKAYKSFELFTGKNLKKISKFPVAMVNDDEYDYAACFEKKGIFTQNRKLSYITCPKTFNSLSPIYFGHEFVHGLKDTKYEEYINQDVTSEVLTLFYEMIVANNNLSDVHDKWKNEFMYRITFHKSYFDEYFDKTDDEVYDYVARIYGIYLSNLYYALNLYSLYKKYPELVLEYVNKVLTQEMTTLEMLKKLGIYGFDKNRQKTFMYMQEEI